MSAGQRMSMKQKKTHFNVEVLVLLQKIEFLESTGLPRCIHQPVHKMRLPFFVQESQLYERKKGGAGKKEYLRTGSICFNV